MSEILKFDYFKWKEGKYMSISFDGFAEKRNTQKQTMMIQLHQMNLAVTKLLDTGLVVIGIRMSGQRPQIEIKYQERCKHFNGAVDRGRQNIHGEIEVKMMSQFCHCDVIWMQPEVTHNSIKMKEETQARAASQGTL